MKKTLLFALALAVIPVGVDAQVEPPISIVKQEIDLLPADLDHPYPVARLKLTIRNNTSQSISAWRAQVHFTDPFGDYMFQTELTAGMADISPNGTSEARFDFEDSIFTGDPYDHLAQFTASIIGIRFEDIQVAN
jgi:hypothetical protein